MNIRRRPLLISAALLALGGCDAASKNSRVIDADWHRKALIDGHLSRWLAASPTPSGMFLTSLDRHWKPKATRNVELTAQGRLIYAMAIGYELTQDKRYLEAALGGRDFLMEHMHDPVHGGFFHVVNADGSVASDAKRSYDHAFALLALSTLARVTQEERDKQAALQAWEEISRGLRHPLGGLHIEASRSFSPAAGALTQNPVMHMFEALLALKQATGDARAQAGAKSLGDFIAYKLLEGLPDGGARVPEWFDETWQALPTKDKGGFVDLGHQFEWSHLLLTASELDVSPIYASVSERVMQYALKAGYDDNEGGAFTKAWPEGGIDRDKYDWQQAECLHAMVAASAGGRNDMLRRYEQTLAFIQAELIDPQEGGWYNGTRTLCRSRTCDDVQPDPYHMTSMHLAAIHAGTRA